MIYRSDKQPLCRYCGRPIAKATEGYHAAEPGRVYAVESRPGPYYSREECQRASNQRVVSVRYETPVRDGEPTGAPRYVAFFSTWDGESYEDEFFCSGAHAQRFAYVLARAGHQTVAHRDALQGTKDP